MPAQPADGGRQLRPLLSDSGRPCLDELIGVPVGKLLASLVDLCAVNGHLERRLDADADLAALDRGDREADVAVDEDGPGRLARQDQHEVLLPEGVAYPTWEECKPRANQRESRKT